MNYLDVCAGISAPTVAWKPLGWKALAYAEIADAPRAVLKHHYPDVPLVGDFTEIRGDEYGPVDLLVGGTPCQSFSVAGLRGGLADDRGNLALEYLRLADRARPRWLVWENVPGVLSSNGGRDFGAILGGMVELGYGVAYRVLDAQYAGVPQRRRRVFVVGYLGDWRRAAAVLFERHSLSGHPPPRRQEGKRIAPGFAGGTGGGGTDFDGGLIGYDMQNDALTGDVAATLQAEAQRTDNRGMALIPSTGDTAHCLNAGGMGRQDYETETLIAHSLRAEGFDASEDGTGRGTPLVPVAAIQERAISENPNAGPDDAGYRTDGQAYTLEARSVPQAIAFTAKDYGGDALENCSPTLRAGGHTGSHANAGVMPAIAFDTTQITSAANYSGPKPGDPCHPLASGAHPPAIAGSAVRRLTPEECEALQGFPRSYTLVPHRGRMMADGPRYKCLGNSMAVPVVRWLGERIEAVEKIASERIAA